MNGCLASFDAAGLRAALGLADANMLRNEVEAFDDDAVPLNENLENSTLLATVSATILATATDQLDEIALFDICHD